MIIALWAVNALLTLAFLGAGVNKLVKSKDALVASGMAWAKGFPPASLKAIGAAEVVGALGLILPLATGVAPILSPTAATCLAVIMLGAIVVHLRHRDALKVTLPSAVLAAFSIVSAVLGFLVV
ncbi:DoxX family protein [Microbacterium sp. GXS0129]|uniref:DoxX family protein n=1 Tax=Microbacterium sp. GXS0129 TaxID=3377836 RepID=UPI00383ACC85